ncbi:MAG: DUF429 domain-containing protein [Deltaproteobacteria bacterium]|nr:DUF429 domain-containing protein [Deltaproteobacteria bacterium]
MVYFTGFDSAWGGKAPGAMCDLQEVAGALQFVGAPRRLSWDEAIRRVDDWASWDDHVVAIDQSLIVPNDTGMRPVERRLQSALMHPFRCGAHASNTGNERCFGSTAGIWRFVDALVRRGYRQEPMAVARAERGRFFFECYPHPALLGLFDLDAVLRYKHRSGDAEAWREALRLVRSLGEPGRAPRLVGVEQQVPADWRHTKEHEDLLDAIVSAYVAAFFRAHGTVRSLMVGDLASGYMVTPVSARTGAALRAAFGDDVNVEGVASSQRPSR